MGSLPGRYRKTKRRTGRSEPVMSRCERRRLIQLGVSLALFVLALAGRSVFPEHVGRWNEVLCGTTDFKAAFSQFGEATAQDEPFLEAMGELLKEVFTGNTEEKNSRLLQTEPSLAERGRATEDYIKSWFYGREDKGIMGEPGSGAMNNILKAKQTAMVSTADAETEIRAEQIAMVTGKTVMGAAAGAGSTEISARSLSMENTLELAGYTTPVYGTVTSTYGYRDHPVSGKYTLHRGVDIGADRGTPIVAFSDGTIECIGESWESGLYLQIDHGNGIKTFYAHCSELYVRKGEQVLLGQTVAAVGESGNATGPHLHFPIIKDGAYLDPALYIQTD